MLKHKFSLREIILILIATVLALGILYYQVIVKNYNEAKSLYNSSGIADELNVLTLKATKKKNMEDYISKHSNDTYGEIATYNNLANEINALANVFNGKVDNVSISWSEPILDGTIVRRNASVSFKTNSYELAKTLVSNISGLRYRCIITSLSMSGSDNNNLSTTSEITVNLQVTFYETTTGASDTSGLTVVEEQ